LDTLWLVSGKKILLTRWLCRDGDAAEEAVAEAETTNEAAGETATEELQPSDDAPAEVKEEATENDGDALEQEAAEALTNLKASPEASEEPVEQEAAPDSKVGGTFLQHAFLYHDPHDIDVRFLQPKKKLSLSLKPKVEKSDAKTEQEAQPAPKKVPMGTFSELSVFVFLLTTCMFVAQSKGIVALKLQAPKDKEKAAKAESKVCAYLVRSQSPCTEVKSA
jgi:hypothetical protein